MVPRRLVWFCDVSLTMQDLEEMYSSDWNKEINKHKAQDPNELQFGSMDCLTFLMGLVPHD